MPGLMCRGILLLITGVMHLGLGGCAGSSDPGPVAREIYQGRHAKGLGLNVAEAPDSLVVVSYNIEFARQTEQAAAELLADPRLKSVDILLLQEMDPQGTEYLAREMGLDYVYAPAYLHSRHDRRWGNAVLSRWPIVDQASVVLPHPNPFSNHHRRAVAADIAIAGRLVRAVSVHLSTVVIPFADRLHQAAVLTDSLGQVGYPLIIGGDFNTGSDVEVTKVGQAMRHAGLQKVRLPAGKTALGGPLDLFDHDLVLDHFFYRGLVPHGSGIGQNFKSSDHLPIWTVFTWPD